MNMNLPSTPRFLLAALLLLGHASRLRAADAPADLDHQKTLYVVGYAHLDTQWRWSYPQVTREFIRKTMEDNFPLFEKYPDYVFNFTGSRRYEFMKEYYPEDFARVQRYVAAKRWFPGGASVEEGDALVSGLESRVRQILYGNRFFQREFKTQSDEVTLPDTFGFPACLPSILAHCGIKGFNTQKLSWGSAVGIPFNLGVWLGVDGQGVTAALNGGPYDSSITSDLSEDPKWIDRVQKDGKTSGVFADFRYFGTGDRGGAPGEESVKWLETSLAGKGPLRVVTGPSNRVFDDLTPAQRGRLPVYKGELLLTGHSTGSLTSKAIMKRFNRENELLANAAESAAATAHALGALPYPANKLYRAWDLTLGSQMHDILPGTCLPKSYEFSWNDEVLALNQFAAVAEGSCAAVASGLDTQVAPGSVPLVVFNPLSIPRQDVVEASLTLPAGAGPGVTVFGPNGQPVPTQVTARTGDKVTLLFLANAPSVGYAVYEARPGPAAPYGLSPLRSTVNGIENERYRVTLDANGDVASILDKAAGKELLQSPAQLVFQYEKPQEWPAWNMDWEDRNKPPKATLAGPAQVSVVESGPVRVTLQVKRTGQDSTVVQRIRLAAGGAGNRVEFATEVDWRSLEAGLKASFPLSVSNSQATYDAQLGTVQRSNNNPKQFEVPQHQWMDLTATDGGYGVSILNDSKYGSDKPDDRTMRLTLLYSPGVTNAYQDQATQEIGHHRMLYAVEGHPGDWRQGNTSWEAARLNQPPMAFAAPAHPGPLGKAFSLLATNSNQVQICSVKKAEEGNEIVVRLRELSGQPANGVRLTCGLPLAGAREINGQETPVGPANLQNGAVGFDMGPYQMRAFALRTGPLPRAPLAAVASKGLTLPYDLDAVSSTKNPADGGFDEQGHTLPAEQFPASLYSEGVAFQLGSPADGQKNALVCRGQSFDLPAGPYNRVYLLAAANGDQRGEVKVDGVATPLVVPDWSEFIGQWDDRLWKGEVPELTYDWNNPLVGLVPGYVKPAPVAWYFSHRHDPKEGNEFYQYAYLFKCGADLPAGAKKITLPTNEKIRVFAVSVASEPGAGVRPTAPLYDTFADHVEGAAPPAASPAPGRFTDAVAVALQPPLYYREGHLRYTTDGSVPTANSPVYADHLALIRDTDLKACEFDAQGRPGPVWGGHYQVDDVNPPALVAVAATPLVPTVEVSFSKPVQAASGRDPGRYVFSSATPGGFPVAAGVAVKSVQLSADAMKATLHLTAPLPQSAPLKLGVREIVEASARANVLRSAERPVDGLLPVYGVASLRTPQEARSEEVAGLPTGPAEPWTLNFFLRCDDPPKGYTLLGGFGAAEDGHAATGAGRYFINFDDGLSFWLANADLNTHVKVEPKRWQMLTATYDGQTVTLYKDGSRIAADQRTLAPDVARVGVGIVDPWERGNKFDGEIRDFKIWKSTLPPEAVKALQQSGPRD